MGDLQQRLRYGRVGTEQCAQSQEHVDLDAALGRVPCPVLLIQADPSHGGVIIDSDVETALSLLSDGMHVQVESAGHDLGLGAWQVDPLLRAVTSFVESL